MIYRDLQRRLATDNFFKSLSFSEILLSLETFSIGDIWNVGNFFRKQDYVYESLEYFLHRMSFFENEDFELAIQRGLYLSLLSLKNVGWPREYEENNGLGKALYDICDSFHYPEGADDLIYMWSSPMKNEEGIRCIKWTPSGSLDRYLDEYKYLLNCWDEVILDNYLELFDSKFALIRNGKFRHHLITGQRKDDNEMSLRIWTEKIFVEEKQHEFSFRSDEELKKFLVDNKVVFDSFISNDFFLDEKPVSEFREEFYENLCDMGYGICDPFMRKKRG
jgi:hypothetical protein